MINTVAIIPAYNEGRTIKQVIEKTNKYVGKVIVVDDCSRDNTINEISKTKAYLIKHKTNQGAGASTRDGITWVINNLSQIKALITLDGDMQHNPDDIPKLLEKVEQGYDFVIAMRIINKSSMPLLRRFANNTLTLLRNFGSKRKIVNGQCGFRAFSHKAITNLTIESDDFAYVEELIFKAKKLEKAGVLRIAEVPIEVIYGDEQDKYSLWANFKRGIKLSMAIIYWRIKVNYVE